MSKEADKNDMLLDRVDESDEVVGRIRRGDVFSTGAGFRVVHAFIFDREHRLLLQRLASGKQRHPGRWGSSVAGYVMAGEDYDGAVRRRTRQELGLENLVLTPMLKTRMNDAGCAKFIQLYSGRSDGPFHLERREVAEIRFETIDVIDREIRDEPDRFTPTFTHLFERHIASNRTR